MTLLPRNGLYVLTDASAGEGATLVAVVRAALRGGARMIQYRDKSRVQRRRRAEAEALLAACRSTGAALIVNDDVSLAAAIGADGVHLGRDDDEPRTARDRLGDDAIIGVSCYNQPERAAAAQEAGADYIAFGRFFASTTKPDALPATVAMLSAARPWLTRPIVAIGGITPENGASLLRAGADLLAVAGAVINQPDPESAARRFMPLFAGVEPQRAAV